MRQRSASHEVLHQHHSSAHDSRAAFHPMLPALKGSTYNKNKAILQLLITKQKKSAHIIIGGY
jgi:hypothetical protein